jgi:hypothetical protein
MGHREEILGAFGLDPEDLEANRTGQMTGKQKQKLMKTGSRDVLSALILIAGLGAILAFVAPRPLAPVQVILAAILGIVLLVVGSNTYRKCRAAAAAGRVESLVGPVQVGRTKAGFHVTIAGRLFPVPIRFWNIQNDATYRVYFAAGTNQVVAMEPEGWS